jgi:hypothetical protein
MFAAGLSFQLSTNPYHSDRSACGVCILGVANELFWNFFSSTLEMRHPLPIYPIDSNAQREMV